MKPNLESLETRDLLAASLVNGVLQIDGTLGSDTLVIRDEGGVITTEGQSFNKADVQRIAVEGNGGYDIVRFELPGSDQRMLTYDIFSTEQYLCRHQIAGRSVAIAINRAAVTDAYFSFHTTTSGRAQGGFILDAGDPPLMQPLPPDPDEDGDPDDYAIILQKHNDDQTAFARLARKNLAPAKLAKKLDLKLEKAGS